MAKDKFPVKEFKLAVKTLNKALKDAGEETIKTANTTRKEAEDAFSDIINKFNEDGRIEEIPAAALDFYNNHLVPNEEQEEPEERPKAKTKAKAKTKGKGKAKAKPKKKAKVGLMEKAVNIYLDGTRDVDKICKAIQKEFPDSNPRKSVVHVMNIMKHVVKRIEA